LNCNFLLINLTDRFSNTNEFAYFLLTNDTRANWSNVPTDMIAGVDYFGMREVFWIEKGSVLVKVTEFSPSLNRIHMNLYKSSKWSGWFSTGGKFDLVDVTVLGKKHTYGRDGSNLFIHAPADNNYYSPVLTGSGYTALFTLNVGYRPARNIHQRIIINNKGQTGIISIFTTGVVSIGYVRSASGVSENQLAEESFWYFTCSLI